MYSAIFPGTLTMCRHKLLKDPVNLLPKIATGVARSAAFLTSFIGKQKMPTGAICRSWSALAFQQYAASKTVTGAC